MVTEQAQGPSMVAVLREWGRIGATGFGGPPTHIRMLRDLCVLRQGWLTQVDFQDAVAACNLLPGPSSTQLAIYCAWRVRGMWAALVGGAAFILPGLVVVMGLAWAFLADNAQWWVLALGAGASAVVPAVAVSAGMGLLPASLDRVRHSGRAAQLRWWTYVGLGVVAAAVTGSRLVLVLVGCGLLEVILRRRPGPALHLMGLPLGRLAGGSLTAGTLASVSWVALKVGLLSYGGGFVIVPMMQADAVGRYHWMTESQFANAVAIGQVTPGPLLQTVALVGFAAAGPVGALVAAVMAFLPSFLIILVGGRYFDRLRGNHDVRSFLDGAGPAAIGAILGSALLLAGVISQWWQWAVLGVGALLLWLNRGVLFTIVLAAGVGVAAVALGAPLPA